MTSTAPWHLNSTTTVPLAATSSQAWAALTDPALSPHAFMGARIELGAVGQRFHLHRGDGWAVRGTVLVKDPPRHLRLTWEVKAPPGVTIPNCQVEFLLAPTPDADTTTLTIHEYVDGPVPPPYARAGATGWALITTRLAAFLATTTTATPPT